MTPPNAKSGSRKTVKGISRSVARVEREYEKQFGRFRRKGTEKSVHLLRVMTRRLLAVFDLFADWVPPAESKRARKKAKGIFTRLGPLRDIQIQLALLPQIAPDGEALEPFYADLRAEAEILSRGGRDDIGRKIPKPVRGVLDRIDAALEAAARTGQGGPLNARLHARATQAFRHVKTLARKVDPENPATIHELRIAFKRFRYMADFLAPVTPRLTRETLERYRWFQGVMGDIQDIVALEIRLKTFVSTRSARSRRQFQPALNEVIQEREARIQKLMRALPEIELLWM